MKILILPLLLMLFANTIFAQEQDTDMDMQPLPPGCVALEISYTENGQLTLGETGARNKKQRLYLLKNQLPALVNIGIEQAEPNNLWSKQLQPEKWTALAMEKEEMTFYCVEETPGSMQYVSCQSALTVCQMLKVDLTRTGNYWLVENITQSELTQVLNKL